MVAQVQPLQIDEPAVILRLRDELLPEVVFKRQALRLKQQLRLQLLRPVQRTGDFHAQVGACGARNRASQSSPR
jgi:hypothetical protein